MTVNAIKLLSAVVLGSMLGLSAKLIADQKIAHASRGAHDLGMYPDCAKHPDFGVIVRSSVDRKYYFIQSCTVADSASGEDFRHEVPFKPVDKPAVKGEN